MQQIYLKDGRVADLVIKTEKGYLVDPYCVFKYYEDNEESAPSGNVELVQEVFIEAPKPFIESECKKVYDRIEVLSLERDKLQEEKSNLLREVDSLKRQKTDLAKLVFNRSDIKNAKRLVVFPKDSIAPVIYDQVNMHKLTLSIEVSDYNPKIRAWIYRFYGDGSYSNGDYFDEKYGVKCDLSDEEVMVLTLERLASNQWSEWIISRTDDKWLTPEFIEKKRQILARDAEREIETTKKEIEKYQKRLSELEKKKELAVS